MPGRSSQSCGFRCFRRSALCPGVPCGLEEADAAMVDQTFVEALDLEEVDLPFLIESLGVLATICSVLPTPTATTRSPSDSEGALPDGCSAGYRCRLNDGIFIEERDGRHGSRFLAEVHHFLGRFIAYPSPEAHVAHTLWIAHAHLMDAWEVDAENRLPLPRT